jgi:hypothetical protein
MCSQQRFFTASLLLFFAAAVLVQGKDFLGDWQGSLKAADGTTRTVFAQVINWGKGEYEAKIVESIYTLPVPAKPLLQLRGNRDGQRLRFNDSEASIADGHFRGSSAIGELELLPYNYESPTLGLAAPAGAELIIGGDKGLSGLRNARRAGGVIDLNKSLGKNTHCTAYLRNSLLLDAPRRALLRCGSDDGVIIFLNGEQIYAKAVPRPLTVDEDRVELSLRAGENVLMLKILQGGGDWSAQARVTGLDGRPLPGLRYRLHPEGLPIAADGAIQAWELAGPYAQAGLKGMALAQQVFAPEQDPASVAWQRVENRQSGGARWRLLEDGAVEFLPKSGSMVSNYEFGDGSLHVEFRTPFMFEARGQNRGNSGVYMQGRYEIQVLDSYALAGRDNECGGIYQLGKPLVNMCLPPGRWQSYDVDFTAPRFDADGNKTANAVITVRHNGVIIHDSLELSRATGGAMGKESAVGPLSLQDHGAPVQFRNVWFLPKP